MLMLKETECASVLAVKDLQRARAYYKDKLDLEPSEDNPDGLLYRLDGGGSFLLYETQFAGTAKNTVVSFRTTDLDGLMADLRGRGVTFEEYDMPGLKTENGVVTMDDGRGAWFVDTEGNILSLLERKG